MSETPETEEQITHRRLAISSQLKYLAEQIENGTLTGFSLVWDGRETLIAGDAVMNIGRSLELVIAHQQAMMRTARQQMAQAQATAAPREPPDGSQMN